MNANEQMLQETVTAHQRRKRAQVHALRKMLAAPVPPTTRWNIIRISLSTMVEKGRDREADGLQIALQVPDLLGVRGALPARRGAGEAGRGRAPDGHPPAGHEPPEARRPSGQARRRNARSRRLWLPCASTANKGDESICRESAYLFAGAAATSRQPSTYRRSPRR